MFNKMIVYKALKLSLSPGSKGRLTPNVQTTGQDRLISLLIHDVFGGEILKTHMKKDWHYYNRIDGERVDFTGSEIKKSPRDTRFEDIPSSLDETNDYIDQADCSTFFMGFVRAFEESVGLKKYPNSLQSGMGR
jgi:hypothetical protein